MDSLRQVILTLNPSEKRYFVMFANAFKTDSGLLKLFELTSEPKEHSEAELVKRTKIKNITEGRSRLRKLLFKAMRSYRTDRNVKQQLRDAISDIEFLENKNLGGEAVKEINKAIKLAQKNDEFQLLALLLDSLGKNMDTTIKADVLLPNLADLQMQMDFAIREGSNLLKANMLSTYLRGIMNSANFATTEEIQKHANNLKIGIKELLAQVKTNQLRIFLMTMHVFCDEDSDNWEAYCKEIIKLYEQNPDLVTLDPFSYDRFLKTYCRKVVLKKDYQRLAKELIQKIESAHELHYEGLGRNPEQLPRLQKKLSTLKLYYCRTNSDWHMLSQLETQTRHELTLEPDREDIVKAINVSILVSCLFKSGAYNKTLEWVQIFYTLPEAGFRKPLIFGVRFFEALSFYRLKQWDVSGNKSVNLYKTIAEQGYSDDYHKHLCTILRKLNQWNLKDANDRNEIKQLADYFTTLRKNDDRQYDNYSVVLNPEETLQDLLNYESNH